MANDLDHLSRMSKQAIRPSHIRISCIQVISHPNIADCLCCPASPMWGPTLTSYPAIAKGLKRDQPRADHTQLNTPESDPTSSQTQTHF